MKALLAALLFAFCLLCPCAHAQQDEAARSRFLAEEAKAKQGDAGAQFMLGDCYYRGEGVEKDFAEAVKWYRKAAEQGNANAHSNLAQLMLGVCYKNGIGVAKDYAEAVKWYRKAAEQGDADAQYMLGGCYRDGEGVEKDFVEAYAWWNLASATQKAPGKSRDILEKKMSPQQVAAAQARTKELRAIVEAKAAK